MSIKDRLAATLPTRSNKGCQTCVWLTTISESDRQAIANWMENGWSMRQLHAICSTDPENPLPVSLSALRNHLQGCT